MLEPQKDNRTDDALHRASDTSAKPKTEYDNLILLRVNEKGAYISTAGQIGKYGIYLINKFTFIFV